MIFYGKLQVFACSVLCILLHEFGHAFVGQKLGYKLNMISLMPYGARLSGSEKHIDANDDIKISIAGPVVNLILILLSFIIFLFVPSGFELLKTFISVNVYTLLFNILPVFPLDGGRLLVAILSKKISRAKALKISKTIGYVISAILFILFFISFFFYLNYMLGLNALFLLISLFDEDQSAYYEKLYPLKILNNSKLSIKQASFDKSEPLFNVYKSIANKNISSIKVMDNKKVIAVLTSKKIIDSILKLPINTKLEDIK